MGIEYITVSFLSFSKMIFHDGKYAYSFIKS